MCFFYFGVLFIQIPDNLRREVQKRLDLISSGKVSSYTYGHTMY